MKNRVNRTNLSMNDETYTKRRKVINIIYECLRLDRNLPRVEVRIVENERNVLGTATMFSKVPHISIMNSVVNGSNEDLLWHVTLHELCHTWFDAPHNPKCPLMQAVVKKPLTKTEGLTIFKKYLAQHNERGI